MKKLNELITKKPVIGNSDWSVVKYNRKVFYNNLWNEDPEFMEARGKVVDSNGGVIALPLRKVFNYLENGAGSDMQDTEVVEAIKKINGSMFHVTLTQKGILYGTTGSAVLGDTETDNDFLNRGRKMFKEHFNNHLFDVLQINSTFVFEVVDNENDPHIINDEDGLYLLCIRTLDGELLSHQDVQAIVNCNNHLQHLSGKEKFLKIPVSFILTFGDLKKTMENCVHEGYMVKLLNGADFKFKIKSPYYLNKKRTQRIKPEKLFSDDWKKYFDDDFYAIVEEIRKDWTLEKWSALEEVDRSVVFDGTYNFLLNRDRNA